MIGMAGEIRIVNILGTNYEIIKDSSGENPKLEDCDGYCETYSKKIVVEEKFKNSTNLVENLDEYKKEVLRHEIIHAFFHESGMSLSRDLEERITEYIAAQIPKIWAVMREVNCV